MENIQTAYDFCISLLGFVEISNKRTPTAQHWETIKNTLSNIEIDGSKKFSKNDPEGFVLWLKGYLAFSSSDTIGQNEWDVIAEQLQKVKLESKNTLTEDSLKEAIREAKKAKERDNKFFRDEYWYWPLDPPKRLEEKPGIPVPTMPDKIEKWGIPLPQHWPTTTPPSPGGPLVGDPTTDFKGWETTSTVSSIDSSKLTTTNMKLCNETSIGETDITPLSLGVKKWQ